MAATLAAVFTVDKLGRKTLLGVGIAGVGVTLALAGVLFAVSAPPLALFVVFAAFLACFNYSYGPVCWIIMSEIFPTAIRGRAMSISRVLALGRLQPRRPDVSVGPEGLRPGEASGSTA